MFAVRPIYALAGALLLTCAGCADLYPEKPKPPTAPPSFTTAHVTAFFQAVTGDPLRSEPRDGLDALVPAARADVMADRYGAFVIFVLQRTGATAVYDSVAPDARGLYWHGRTAMKPYRNVVLAWTGEERATDERFRRLDAVLTRLAEPPARARAALPPEDRPCGTQPLGACRDPRTGAAVTTVARDAALELPGLRVRVLRVAKRKGRTSIALRVQNLSEEPLDGLYDARLRVGEKLHRQDGAATFAATPRGAFPLASEHATTATVVFDAPAKDALLAFPSGDGARIRQIRLS